MIHCTKVFSCFNDIINNIVLREKEVIKFDLQLYKVQNESGSKNEDYYVIDFRRFEGSPMSFMILCDNITKHADIVFDNRD